MNIATPPEVPPDQPRPSAQLDQIRAVLRETGLRPTYRLAEIQRILKTH